MDRLGSNGRSCQTAAGRMTCAALPSRGLLRLTWDGGRGINSEACSCENRWGWTPTRRCKEHREHGRADGRRRRAALSALTAELTLQAAREREDEMGEAECSGGRHGRVGRQRATDEVGEAASWRHAAPASASLRCLTRSAAPDTRDAAAAAQGTQARRCATMSTAIPR